MTDGERNKVASELAELRSTVNQGTSAVAELRGTINTFMNTWRTQDERANQTLRSLDDGQTDLRISVGGLTRDLAEVVNDVAEIRPKVEKLESAYNKGWGAVSVIRIIGGLVVLALGWALGHLTSLSIRIP